MSYVKESTYGVHPGGSIKDFRLTGESLKQETTTVNSAEIRSDRQVPYVARTNIKASGGINLELSYGAYDDLFEYGLLSAAWDAVETLTGTIYSMAAADDSINRSSGDFTAGTVFVAGQWVRVSGFATAANNGYFKINTVAATKITFLNGASIVDEAVGPTVTITQGATVKNGTTLSTLAIERRYVDIASEFAIYTGMAPEQFNLALALDQIITGGFEFMGAKEISATASSGSGYTAAPANDVMNVVDNIAMIQENHVALAEVIAFNFTVKNNLRARQQLGTLGAISIGTGKIDVTGTLQAYFSSKTLFDKYLNFSDTKIAIAAKDAANNAYVFDFPRVKFTSGQRVAGGENTDIIADLNFSAFRYATDDLTCRITRFATGT